MDLVNDLSSDLAVAVFVDGILRRKLPAEDAKSFIEAVESELNRISEQTRVDQNPAAIANSTASLSH